MSADIRTDQGIAWGSRWRTSIDSDGVLVAAAPVTDEALGWTNQPSRSGFIISPIFLLEWTNDVFRTFHEVLQPATRVPNGQWLVVLIALGMRRANVALPAGAPRYVHDDEAARPSSDDFQREYQPTGDSNRDTFNVLRLFYALFGLGSDAIPFCRDGAFSTPDFLAGVRR